MQVNKHLILFGIICVYAGYFSLLNAQAPTHANTPIEIYPFSNFQTPHYMFFEERLPYLGAAREYDYPTDVESVKIGFIGPLEGGGVYYTKSGHDMLKGTQVAVDEANQAGGYRGLPFELIARNDIGLWGASGDELVTLYDMGAVAAIGSIDGNNSHVAIRVALKLEIPMVNTASTDPTLTDTRIPWVIRTNPDDRQFNYALLNEIYNIRGYTRVALIRANSRYARVGTREFVDGARRLGNPVVLRQVFLPGETEFGQYLENIRLADAEAVVVWGEVDDIARIVKQMRALGMDQVVFSSEKVLTDTFLELAGEDAEGVVGVFPYNPNNGKPEYEAFVETYKDRYGYAPGHLAVLAYDGARLLLESIKKAGLNKALIRDEITSIEEYDGVTGRIHLDGSWNNAGPVWLAEYINGELKFWEYKWARRTGD
jgi:branched-chain amino acid transport system substrate-binding protein